MKKEHSDGNLVLQIAPCIAAVALVLYIVGIFVCAETTRVWVSNILFAVPILIADFWIVRAYVAHSKNTMKSLIGFILSGLVMMSMHYAFSYFNPTKWYYIVKAVIFVLISLFTVNQFLLSNDHYSRPVILFINQGLMVLLTVISVGAAIADIVLSDDNAITFIGLLIFVMSSMFIVLDIEMKVNECKVKREANGYVFVKSETSEEQLEKEDMFIGDKLFYSLPWLIVVGLVAMIAFNAVFDKAITWGYSIRYLFYVIKSACLFTAVHTYKTHNKNVMKIMLGFLLGMLLFENIFEITFISVKDVTSIKSIATLAMLPVNIVFLILHLLLTQTHAGNKTIVKMMKIVYIIYAVLTIFVAVACSVYYLTAKLPNYYFFVFKPLLWILGTFPVIVGVLTIDTRVNGYKIKREQKQ